MLNENGTDGDTRLQSRNTAINPDISYDSIWNLHDHCNTWHEQGFDTVNIHTLIIEPIHTT